MIMPKSIIEKNILFTINMRIFSCDDAPTKKSKTIQDLNN